MVKKKKINSQLVWEHAKKVIPGGTHLFSKRPELFLPSKWPTYYKKSKGCYIWDLNGKKYIDLSFMGVGTNTLGYANQFVDREVAKMLKTGNMTTLNSLDDIKLAKKLIKLHPWFDMARFTRSGGEANAVAIRIARASTKKSKVAICGYHGWHDWYLAANLKNKKNLEDGLMKGLQFSGVPKNLINTVFPFKYNDFEGLKMLIKKNPEIGIIKMEVSRNFGPENNFLKKVKNLSQKKNIILIFDECTSGFRETFGGLHKKYNIKPDICIFGKALGNGYAINAILGKKNIMKNYDNTFISSTFWTERVGPTAALATLKLMEKLKSWKKISVTGNNIKSKWEILATKYNLDVKINGLASLPSFEIIDKDWMYMKTYITQEFLKKGILAANTIFVCTHHNEKILKQYFEVLEKIFKTIAKWKQEKKNIKNLIKSPVCKAGFFRLN